MFELKTHLTRDGKLIGTMCNEAGTPVASMTNPVDTLDQALELAYQFYKDNPDLFKTADLVDTPAEFERKNPELFESGGLNVIPEG